MPPELEIEERNHKWGRTILKSVGVLLCIFIFLGIVFAIGVFKEVGKYEIVIDPKLAGAKIQLNNKLNDKNSNADEKTINTSGIKGMVTIGPVCPVEMYPPDPNCADKPYSGVIDIVKSGKIVKTFSSKPDGTFSIDLEPGVYTLSPSYKSVMPTFYPVEVVVKSGSYTPVNIEFDSGIR